MLKKWTCGLAALLYSLPLLLAQPADNFADRVTLRSGQQSVGRVTALEPAEGLWLAQRGGDTLFIDMGEVRKLALSSSWPDLLPADADYKDVVRLNDGAVFSGFIVDYRKDGSVVLATDGRQLQVIDKTAIYRIEYEKQAGSRQPAVAGAKRSKPVPEKGWLSTLYMGMSMAEGNTNGQVFIDPFNPFVINNRRTAWGYHVGYVLLRQSKKVVGYGGGISYDAYDPARGESMINLMGRSRYLYNRRHLAWYGLLDAGYGLGLRNANQQVTAAGSGWLLHPAIGVRLGAKADYNFTFDLGYRFQAASFTQRLPFSGDVEIRELTYQRLSLRAGIVF